MRDALFDILHYERSVKKFLLPGMIIVKIGFLRNDTNKICIEIGNSPGYFPAMLRLFRLLRKSLLKVRVVAHDVPEGDRVYIVGNHPQLGGWQPDRISLTAENGEWVGEFPLKRNTFVEFKLTRGSWDSEAAGVDGRTHNNHSVVMSKDREMLVEVVAWKDTVSEEAEEDEAPQEPEERIHGTVKFHREFEVNGLQNRDIVVWLPPQYEEDEEARFPVLYMHDGQNIFDPQTAYTGVDWEADETASNLLDADKVLPFIIVGIYNCDDRLEEYSWSEMGEKYRHFICGPLKQFIDETYRTDPSPQSTATMGSSMGGLVSFLLAWFHSDVVGLAACMSPSFIYRRNRAIRALRRSDTPAIKPKIYMDCGGVGGEALLYRGCRKVIRFLRRRGIKEGATFTFFYDPDANHSESAWASRLSKPMEFLFGKR